MGSDQRRHLTPDPGEDRVPISAEPDHAATTGDDADGSRTWLTPGVLSVGAASLGSDAGHELTTSLLPTFLTSTLHAGPAALGAIEGVADALVGLSKLAGGPLSADRDRRARLAVGGYLFTALATGAIALAATVWQAGALRAAAWVSRGLRSPARDALLVSLVPRRAFGRAAGLERAGDNLGALIGPLLASALISVTSIRVAMLFAVIPGLFAAAAITVAGREAKRVVTTAAARQRLSLNLGQLRRAGLARVLAPILPFELGNVAATLLILRATELLYTGSRSLTAATSVAILMYAGHNAAAALTALFGGRGIDRRGPLPVFALGAGLYAIAYAGFALPQATWPVLLVAFVLAGAGIGTAETAETARVALALPDELRGNGFGVLGLVQSFGDLGASVIVGALWTLFSPTAAFAYAAGWMLLAVAVSTGQRLRG